jgi:hypothetical protein
VIRDLWDELETEGVPSMATHTHKLHKPHVSLIVAEHLPVNASLQAVGPVPTEPIRLLIEAAGVFPGGFLFLACVANVEMLDEQRRVHRAVQPLAVDPWANIQVLAPHSGRRRSARAGYAVRTRMLGALS